MDSPKTLSWSRIPTGDGHIVLQLSVRLVRMVDFMTEREGGRMIKMGLIIIEE